MNWRRRMRQHGSVNDSGCSFPVSLFDQAAPDEPMFVQALQQFFAS